MSAPVNQTHPTGVDDLRRRLGFWLRCDPARLLWPSRCLACEADGEDGLDLCGPCVAALPWNASACGRCAQPLPQPAAACGACLSGRASALTEVHAACLYAPPLDRLLLRFKFHGDLAAGRLLTQLMAQAFAGRPRPAALLPVPLHRSRLRQRGYDQALELARPLARSLDLPLLDGLLTRRHATAPQSQLDASARKRNLKDAFHVQPSTLLPLHVTLVDDVMTTGATLQAAALALRRAGVARVDAWVCARVP